MIKKACSIILIMVFLFNIFKINSLYWVDTNWLNSPWTYEKAIHLAQRALYNADEKIIKELYLAWDSQSAVNILFPSMEGPDKAEYNQKLVEITSDQNFDTNNSGKMKSYYIAKRIYDPYEAKSKFFSLMEDTFSVFVNGWKDITYMDIENNHELLYDLSFWSYKELIKRNLYNNWSVWDYAAGRFLDLFNQSNPNYPNQNYPRELMQLFLMWEYLPTQSEDNWWLRNYSEDDVSAVSKILFWFESNENTHEVTYNSESNTNTIVTFLDWDLKNWDSFPFYNEETWELDIQLMKNSIEWNNWLPDNIIDYIFSKREYEISMFLANKLYRFYLNEEPTFSELNLISFNIISNDFRLYDTIKWLLSSDMMYSDKTMNAIIFKNPLELSIWTNKKFEKDISEIRVESLTNLGWNPYFPPNIFWRDGFDKNASFFTAYTQTQWFTELSYIVKDLDIDYLLSGIKDWDSILWNRIEIIPYNWTNSASKNNIVSKYKELIDIKTSSWSNLWWNVHFWNITINNWNVDVIVNSTWSIDFSNVTIVSWENIITLNETEFNHEQWIINIVSWELNWEEVTWTAEIDWFYNIYLDYSPENIITYFENIFYLWNRLDTNVKEKLLYFLTHNEVWEEVIFNVNDVNYKNFQIKWLIHLMLSQPEYILKSWFDIIEEKANEEESSSFLNNDSKLIIIKSWWWFDFLHWVIPKNEYETYKEYRWTWALTWDEIIDLNDDYYINSKLSPFKELYDNWNLTIINRVWTPDHSRWHDSASRKITSLNNLYDETDEWIIGHFIQNEDFSKTVVMWGYDPLIFRWGNYLNIWNNAYFNISDYTNNNYRDYKKETLKEILNNRSYNNKTNDVFKNSVTINNVSIESQNNWWRAWAWYNMADNFTFLESIFDSWVASIARMWADWWYDTHSNQKDWLNNNLEKVANSTYDYFNKVKNKQDVTIVIFSEFWRTNKINSSMWTDHWQWWWMFIISNNNNIRENLTEKIYWNLSFKDSKYNWLWVWIDYRSVYTSLMNLLYNNDISGTLWGYYDINNYIDKTWPKIELFRKEYEDINQSLTRVRLKFDINDTNFKPDQASYIKLEYWKDKENMYEESLWRIENYMEIDEDRVNLYLNNIESETNYFYKVTIYDNQYNTTILEWSFTSPKINQNLLSDNTDTRIRWFNNRVINNELILEENEKILLWNENDEKIILWENWIKLKTYSWSYIEKITSTNSWTIWNWWFILPKEVNKNYFLKETSSYSWVLLSELKTDKLISVWADTLWIWLSLNKDLEIIVENTNNKKYWVITSEDWINWTRINQENINLVWNELLIKTNHFSYYLTIEIDDNEDFIIDIEDETSNTETENTSKNYKKSWWSLEKDKCEYWDYSESYYDKTCWEDPEKEVATMWYNESDTYRLEQAIEQLREKEYFKAEAYETVKNDTIDDKKEILILLREKLSYMKVWKYEIVYIKNSNLNGKFKKLVSLIIDLWFNENDTDKIVNEINNLILYVALYKSESISIEVKNNSKAEINNSVKKLSKLIKEANKNKKIDIIKNKEIIELKNDDKKIYNEEIKNNEEIIDKKNNIKELSYYEYYVNTESVLLKADPYWKEDIWFLTKWDIVEQLTKPHEKWFFMIKVIESKNIKSWTIWYIFLKHLTK